jgi:TRAP-type mannitol/chloroaromatic compound transport system substrate-binding protein
MKQVQKSLVLTVCVILVLGLAATASAEKKIMMKITTAFSTALPTLGECMPFFKEYVEAASENTIRIKIYEPGKLMPAFEIHDAVSTGKVDAGYTAPVYLSGKVRATELFTYIPFGVALPAYLGWFYHGNGQKLYQEMYEQAGYNIKAFPFCFLAPETGGWFSKPIEKPEDLKGVRVRWPGIGGKVLARLGASVSMIPGGEIFPALEKGAIDGTEFSVPAIDTKLGFYKVAKYNYFPGWHQPATHLELVLNKDTWNEMSPRQKAVMELAARAVNVYTLSRSTYQQGPVVAENAEKHGVHNEVYSDELLALFKKTWDEVIAEESEKDPFLKKVWDDYKAYEASYKPWGCIAHLPRPECK